jgi:hypothetical protein
LPVTVTTATRGAISWLDISNTANDSNSETAGRWAGGSARLKE